MAIKGEQAEQLTYAFGEEIAGPLIESFNSVAHMVAKGGGNKRSKASVW